MKLNRLPVLAALLLVSVIMVSFCERAMAQKKKYEDEDYPLLIRKVRTIYKTDPDFPEELKEITRRPVVQIEIDERELMNRIKSGRSFSMYAGIRGGVTKIKPNQDTLESFKQGALKEIFSNKANIKFIGIHRSGGELSLRISYKQGRSVRVGRFNGKYYYYTFDKKLEIYLDNDTDKSAGKRKSDSKYSSTSIDDFPMPASSNAKIELSLIY